VSQDAKRGNLKQFFLKDFTQIEKKKSQILYFWGKIQAGRNIGG
jgi:hypothetical protein